MKLFQSYCIQNPESLILKYAGECSWKNSSVASFFGAVTFDPETFCLVAPYPASDHPGGHHEPQLGYLA